MPPPTVPKSKDRSAEWESRRLKGKPDKWGRGKSRGKTKKPKTR